MPGGLRGFPAHELRGQDDVLGFARPAFHEVIQDAQGLHGDVLAGVAHCGQRRVGQ